MSAPRIGPTLRAASQQAARDAAAAASPTVETDVPLPAPIFDAAGLAKRMPVGGSAFFPRTVAWRAKEVARHLRKLGHGAMTRKVEGGHRVWRTS